MFVSYHKRQCVRTLFHFICWRSSVPLGFQKVLGRICISAPHANLEQCSKQLFAGGGAEGGGVGLVGGVEQLGMGWKIIVSVMIEQV